MLENLEKQIVERQEQLMSLDIKLNNGKIKLKEYEEVKNGLKWQITELQNKVNDKMVALGNKESELNKLTKEVDAVSSVI